MKTNKLLRVVLAVLFCVSSLLAVLGSTFWITSTAPVISSVGAYVADHKQESVTTKPEGAAILHAIEDTRSMVLDSIESFDESRARRIRVGSLIYDARSVDHLRDVHQVVAWGNLMGVVSWMLALGAGWLLCRLGAGRWLPILLSTVGGVYLFISLGIGIWAVIDFSHLFTTFHGLFFAEGTWLFSYDSLLITLFPEQFWIISGSIWLALILSISTLLVLFGVLSRQKTGV